MRDKGPKASCKNSKKTQFKKKKKKKEIQNGP